MKQARPVETPIQFTDDDGERVELRCAGEEGRPWMATESDLVACLLANPELRVAVLEKMPEHRDLVGTICDECGAVWRDDRQLEMLEPYRKRATAAEAELSKLRDDATELAKIWVAYNPDPMFFPSTRMSELAQRILASAETSGTKDPRAITDSDVAAPPEPSQDAKHGAHRVELTAENRRRGDTPVDDVVGEAGTEGTPSGTVGAIPVAGAGDSAAPSETRCEFFDRMVNRRCRNEPGHQGPHVYRMNDDEESSEAERAAPKICVKCGARDGQCSLRGCLTDAERAADEGSERVTLEQARLSVDWLHYGATEKLPREKHSAIFHARRIGQYFAQSEREVASLTSELATAREMIYDAERREEALREELATAQQELEDAWRNDKPITNDQMILNLEEQLRFCYEFRARPLPGGYGPVHAFRKELVEALRASAEQPLVFGAMLGDLADRLDTGGHQ